MSAYVINFSDFDDSNGFILNRISSLRCSGYSVSPPGNVGGDTHDIGLEPGGQVVARVRRWSSAGFNLTSSEVIVRPEV
jgi:hypothetical protein